MKFVGIDESGKSNQYFLLCAVIIDGDDLIEFSRSILSFQYNHDLSDFKDLRKPMDNKFDLICELADILKLYDLKVISVVLGPNTLNDINNYYDGKYKESKKRFECLKYVTERIYKHLEKTGDTGQVIFDDFGKVPRNLLKSEFNNLITEKGFQMPFRDKYDFEKSICPSMCFSKDNEHCVLQVADLIGYALKKAFEEELDSTDFNNLNPDLLRSKNYLDLYWPFFEKNHSEKVKGYGIKLWNYNICSIPNKQISENKAFAGVLDG